MSNYFELQNSPVLTTPSALTAPKITSIGYPGDDTAADPAGGQTITLTGEGFEAGASVIVNNAAVGVVSVVSSTTITFTSPAQSTGSYPVYVVNTDGGTAIAVPGIQYSGTPTWTTAAGSLGSYTETQAISNTVTATGDAPISYSLFSGTLPTGATLNSANGLISGTSSLSASPTTYTFTIRATDAQQQDTNRQFSLTINPDVVTWSSPANGTTYTTVVDSAISNVALSATAASGQSVSYTANALPTGLSISGSNITGTPTVVANSSTLLTATASTTNATATRTINWVISVASDPSFAYVTTLLSANNPASTFVTDASTNNFAVSVFGDTRPNNFGPYTPGYYSNFFDGNGDYLSLASNTAFAFGTGDFTVEAWIMRTGGSGNQPICQSDAIGTSQNDKWWFAVAGGGLFFGTHNAGGFNVVTTTTFDANVWYHVAVSRSSGTMYMFVNGVSTAFTTSGTPSGYNLGQNGFTVGGMSTPSYWTGYISNLRVTKGTALYTSSFTVSSTPLTAVASTSLLTCQSNRFIDTSTNNFTITRFGDTLVSGFDPFAPLSTYSTYGSGYFDGTGDYLSVPDNAALDFGSSDFTIECWFYPTTTPNNNLFAKRSSSSLYAGVMILFGGFAPSIYATTTGTNWELATTSTIGCVLNTWNHIAFTRSGNTWRIFVNGVLGTSATLSGTVPDNSGAATIGAGAADGSFPISSSYISDVRIIKGTAVYTSAFTPPAAPLTAITNTSLLTLQNNQPNNNNMFLDSSASNFLITRNGNTTQGSFSPYGGGWSNYFDGTGDYLSLSYNAAISIVSGDFTVEMWIYRTAGSAEQYLWSNRSDNPGTGWEWRINSTNLMQFFFTAGSSLTSASTIPVNTWTHLAVTRQTNTVRMFINGTQDATATFSNGTGTSASLFIGWSTSSGGLFQGYMSNARLVKGTAVYTSNFTPPTAPLTPITNTSLLTCADNRFVDDSANNFTITRNGDVSIQRFNPFNPVLITPTSYSGYFDGNGDYLRSNYNTSVSNIGSGNYTMEAWVYYNGSTISTAGYTDIFLTNVGYGMLLYNGVLTAYNLATGNPAASSAIPANTWVHLAIVKSGSTVTGYQNGTQVLSGSGATDPFPASGNFIIGSWTNGTSEFWTGYISNVRLSNTVRYSGSFTPSTTPFTSDANTLFLACQSATFVDNSTNNFAVTAFGNSQPIQFNPFGWTSTTGENAAYSSTNYGGSMYFDDTGDFLLTPSDPAFTLGSSGDFTIECWFYLSSSPSNYAPLATTWTDAASSGGYNNRWALAFFNSRLSWFTSAGSINVQDPTNIVLNQWTHVAIMKSGSTFIMYKNGVLVGSNTTTDQNYTTQGALRVGSVPSGGSINGYITNLRIVKGQALYTSNFALPVAPLSFNANAVLQVNGTSAAIYDSSMIATYETVGNAQSTGVIKKYGNSSLSFDGTGDYLTAPSSQNFAFGTSNFTVECWVYYAAATNSGIFQIGTSLFPLVNGIGAGLGTTNNWLLYYGNGSQTQAGSMSPSTWYHVAVVRNSGTTRMYVNGTQIISVADTANYTGTVLGVGGIYSTQYLMNGYVNDFRITNGVARYTANFTPPTTPFMQN